MAAPRATSSPTCISCNSRKMHLELRAGSTVGSLAPKNTTHNESTKSGWALTNGQTPSHVAFCPADVGKTSKSSSSESLSSWAGRMQATATLSAPALFHGLDAFLQGQEWCPVLVRQLGWCRPARCSGLVRVGLLNVLQDTRARSSVQMPHGRDVPPLLTCGRSVRPAPRWRRQPLPTSHRYRLGRHRVVHGREERLQPRFDR